MELVTKKQIAIAKSFFNRVLDGQPIGAGWSRPPKETYFGHDSITTTMLAQALWAQIFFEQPQITQEAFDELLSKRIYEMHSITDKLKLSKAFTQGPLNGWSPKSLAHYLFTEMRSQRTNYADALRSFRLFTRFLPSWLNQKPLKIGPYTIQNTAFPHIECPLAITITNQEGSTVATIGGVLQYHNGSKRPFIRINNLQGKKARDQRKEETQSQYKKRFRAHVAQYERLSSLLKENWRTHFAKQVISIAQKKGLHVVGELPQRFVLLGPLSTNEEYARQQKVVGEAYLNAGMKRRGEKFFIPTRRK